MIKFILAATLVILASGCATKKVPAGRLQELRFVNRTIPVADRKAAKAYLQNQVNYLKILFEQSKDPYYGQPKWTEECLKTNRIGEIENFDGGLLVLSDLLLDEEGNPGFCPEAPEESFRAYSLLLYCEPQKQVQEMKIRYEDGLVLKGTDLCKG